MTGKVVLALAFTAGLASVAAQAKEEETGKRTQADRLWARAQGLCPVSGKEVMSMGGPIRAKSGERTLFLCCKSCLGQRISKEHWQKMTASLIAAQQTCPVMGKPLPKNPASIVVEGRTVFVCCKPCTAKIKADPERYLAIVNESQEKKFAEEDEARKRR